MITDEEVKEMLEEIEKMIGYKPRYYTLASPDGEVVDDFGKIVILRDEEGEHIRHKVYAVYYDSILQESWEGLRSYEDALRVAEWIWENTGVGDIEKIREKLRLITDST